MTPQERARALRPYIEKAAASLSDRDASLAVELSGGYPGDGSLVEAGTRINWKGELFRAAVSLWATEQNDPDHAPNLWERVLYRDGIRIIPEVITAGLTFARDELGWWGDVLYKSLYDNNAHTPAAWPQGWEAVT